MKSSKATSKSGLHPKEIQTTLESMFDKIDIKLKKAENGFDHEEIHSFRTEIKKLKAFLRLLSVKFPKKLNQIYKILGHIRILQLQKLNIGKLVQEVDIKMPATCAMIHTETVAYKKKVTSLTKDYHFFKKNITEVKNIISDKITQISTRRYIKAELKNLHNILALEEIDDESMHDIRKLLKDFHYNESLLKNDFTAESNARLFLSYDIQSVTELLGDFHDICVAINLLDEELTTPAIFGDERQILLDIWNKWQADKNHLRNQLDQELEKLKQYQV